MEKLRTTDVRISKLISSFTNYDGADLDGDIRDEGVIRESKNIVLKDNPEACHFVFNAMKDIIFEDCAFLFSIVDLEIIEKNDRILGSYSSKDNTVRVVIEDEPNMNIINTMAHELRHAFQHYNGWLHKSFVQKDNHSKVISDYMYSLEDFSADEEHVRQVLYRTSWHEVDARRYAQWFTRGGVGEFEKTEYFDINEGNIGKKLIAQLLAMGEN